MKSWQSMVLKGAVVLCALGGGAGVATHADDVPAEAKPATKVATPVLDLPYLSIPVRLDEGEAEGCRFPLGHSNQHGWFARVAGANPRTPAIQDGTLVVGSGKGTEVYGYDVSTGKRKWTAASNDDGISSIEIEDGYAYYTTHSCTLEKIRVSDGKKEYSTYLAPEVECAPDVQQAEVATSVKQTGGWQVALRETQTGKTKWETPIGRHGVVTGPIILGGNVYITTVDGRLTRIGSAGKKDWSADIAAVSAPVPTPWGLLVTTTWDGDESKLNRVNPEQRKKRARETASKAAAEEVTVVAKDDRRVVLMENSAAEPTSKVGEEPRGPHVSLNYQGVRPGVTARHVILAYKGEISAVNPVLGRVDWTIEIADTECEFVRPVAHRGLVFVASNTGVVAAIEESSGAVVWSYKFKDTYFIAEPAIDDSNLVLTTMDGIVICIPTGAGTVDGGAPKPVAADEERIAAAYWPLQKKFREARGTVDELVHEERKTDREAERRDSPGNGAPRIGGAGGEAIRPRDDE